MFSGERIWTVFTALKQMENGEREGNAQDKPSEGQGIFVHGCRQHGLWRCGEGNRLEEVLECFRVGSKRNTKAMAKAKTSGQWLF